MSWAGGVREGGSGQNALLLRQPGSFSETEDTGGKTGHKDESFGFGSIVYSPEHPFVSGPVCLSFRC